MERKDLFEGAIVSLNGNVCKVELFDGLFIKIKGSELYVTAGNLQAVKFDESFLKELGFESIGSDTYQVRDNANGLQIYYYDSRPKKSLQVFNDFYSCENLFVHELQLIIKAARILENL
jgi:hypothetical protein